MAQAQHGSKVKIHYTGRLEDGTVFDSSEGRDPLEFTLGEGRIIPGFETGTMGMTVGQKKTISIPPDEAYGDHREDLVAHVNRNEFPEGADPAVGQVYQMDQGDGQSIDLRVIAVEGEDITLDANHPLAGQTLIFDIELVSMVCPDRRFGPAHVVLPDVHKSTMLTADGHSD
jgi:FKBP-type peptidyl-prolyl cis-trans isomerase 2